MLQKFLEIKSAELQYARNNNLKALEQVLLNCIAKTKQLQEVSLVNKQFELF